LPPIDPESHVYLDMLFDVGPVQAGGFGPQCVSWSEIESWMRLNGHQLSSPEARLLRRLSSIYVAAQQELRAADAPAPWPQRHFQERLDATTEKIGLALSAMSRRPTA